MATYKTQTIKGDFAVETSGSSQFGLGKIHIADEIELTATYTVGNYKRLYTLDANLEISSQRSLRIISGATQGIDITANNTSTWKTTSGQLNVLSDTNTVNIDGVNVSLGVTTANLNMGNVINTNDSKLYITNNLYEINSGLTTIGNDYGMLIRRNLDDVITDTSPLQVNLDVDATTGSSTVVIQYSAIITANHFEGWTLSIGSEEFIITASVYTTVTTLTIDGTLGATTVGGTQVSLYNTTFTSIFYSEANTEWRISYTNSVNGSRLINQNQYATLHVGSLVLENEITTSSMKVVDINLGANIAFAGRVSVGATDGTLSGSYMVIVNRYPVEGGATATFMISKSVNTTNRDAFRSTSDPGQNGEELFCTWQSGEYLSFYHDTLRSLGNLTEVLLYKVRLISIA